MIGKAVLGTDIEFYVKFICLSCLGLFCVWLLYLYTLLVTSARFVTQIYTAKPKFLCFFFVSFFIGFVIVISVRLVRFVGQLRKTLKCLCVNPQVISFFFVRQL